MRSLESHFTNLLYLNFYRIDRDKTQILAEISDVRAAAEEVTRSKVKLLWLVMILIGVSQ